MNKNNNIRGKEILNIHKRYDTADNDKRTINRMNNKNKYQNNHSNSKD
jgi:hypothetical protein